MENKIDATDIPQYGILIMMRRRPSSSRYWDDAIVRCVSLSLSRSLTNKQCCLLHAWGTRDRLPPCLPPSVRHTAGKMDVSVSIVSSHLISEESHPTHPHPPKKIVPTNVEVWNGPKYLGGLPNGDLGGDKGGSTTYDSSSNWSQRCTVVEK